MNNGQDILAAALTEALDRRQCASAWVGHRSVLFLGLGTAVLADRGADGRRATPPYELQTNFTDWSIELPEGPLIADNDRDRSEAAARALVGRPVADWHVFGEQTLRVRFHGGPVLTVVPLSDADSADKAAWWLCLPGGRIVGVACDGRVVAADSRRQTCDWFKRPAE
jgi:hypothetical protein